MRLQRPMRNSQPNRAKKPLNQLMRNPLNSRLVLKIVLKIQNQINESTESEESESESEEAKS